MLGDGVQYCDKIISHFQSLVRFSQSYVQVMHCKFSYKKDMYSFRFKKSRNRICLVCELSVKNAKTLLIPYSTG